MLPIYLIFDLLYYLFFGILDGGFVSIILWLIIIYFVVNVVFGGTLPNPIKFFRRHKRFSELKQTVKTYPGNIAAALEFGEMLLERRKYEQALVYLERANERITDSARLAWLMGECFTLLQKYDLGLTNLEQAVSLDPKMGFGRPYVFLLHIELHTSNDPGKIESLKDKVLIYGSTEACYKAGKLLKKHGDKVGAIAMFKEVLGNYEASPGKMRKIHRKWALLSRVNMAF